MYDLLFIGIVAGGLFAGLAVSHFSRRRAASERRRAVASQSELAEATQKLNALQGQVFLADRLVDTMPLPLFLLDRGSRVLRNNTAAIRLTDKDLTGRDISSGFRQPGFMAAINRVLETGEPAVFDLTIPAPVKRAFLVRIEPARPEQADPRQPVQADPAIVLVMQDVTSIAQSDRMRADFVANVSHELRTPLTSLIGFVETLRGPARDDADARDRFLGIMQEQANRMYRLISDLLSLSKIEMEEHSPPGDAVDLHDVIHAVTDTLAFRAADRGMKLDVDVPDNLPLVTGDIDQLIQVFQNLVDNALKYGKAGTPVTVSATAKGSTVTVSVRDRGDGIPRDHLPRLTERFYRIDAARSRELGGTGLGLAIVKHIISRHRGKLSIQSEPGQGSRFEVTLPKR